MKILIFYASYGGGHLSASMGIKEEIQKSYPDYEVEIVDCMEYLNKSINYITVKAYEGLAKKMPKLWGKVYKASRKGIVASISNSLNKLFTGKLGMLIKEINPDLIISAHPFSNQMCAILKSKGKLDLKVYSILTDFKYHEQWLVKHEYLDKIFVSNEKMKEDLITYGVDASKLFATGLPISKRFSEKYNKQEILNEFGLKNDLKTVLFFAGGKMGLARKNIFNFMEVLARNSDDMQVIAISGKNEKIYYGFQDIAEGHENVKVLEFTDKVPKLMSISDVVITKPRRNHIIRGT